jgi:phosphoglycolate phosphatase
MVGDTTYDMELARAAGCRTVAVSWGYHDPKALLAAGAGTLIHDYSELDEAIDRVLE